MYWWHRLLGFTHAGASFLNPFPPPLALLVALLWATERRVRGFASRLAPPAAGGDKERILHIPANTGMGDLLCQPSLMLYAARMLGFKKLAVDWRRSSYLTDRDVDLFAELFDVVSTPDVEVVPIGQVDAARHVLVPVKVSAVSPTPVSCWDDRGWRVLSPQIVYFGDFLDRFPLTPNDTWWDAPLAETPPPFQWFRGLPINRGVWRRIFRDERAFVDAILLKPQFLQPFEAFVQRELLSGAGAVGVRVRRRRDGRVRTRARRLRHRSRRRWTRACPHRALLPSQSAAHDPRDERLAERGVPAAQGGHCAAWSRASSGSRRRHRRLLRRRLGDRRLQRRRACTPPDELQLAADAVIDMLCSPPATSSCHVALDVHLLPGQARAADEPRLGQLNRGVHDRGLLVDRALQYN